MSTISPLAYVHPEAKIGENVKIYPFAYIERDVVIGDGCVIMSHASILEGSVLGTDNYIYQNAVIGAVPQSFRYTYPRAYRQREPHPRECRHCWRT